LADHSLVSDTSEVATTNADDALAFASLEAATLRAKQITRLFPEVAIDPVDVPFPLGQSMLHRRG
jgi:hypothetical protein